MSRTQSQSKRPFASRPQRGDEPRRSPLGEGGLEARIEQLTQRVEALLTIVAPIVTRRVSNERQAKIAGVSRTTLWRRRRRAAAQLSLRPRTAA